MKAGSDAQNPQRGDTYMIVYGVSKNGQDVQVNDDFSIHLPYGYCYDIGNEDAGDETALFLAKPA